jgi:subtilisin-like proprotein convertase family protein
VNLAIADHDLNGVSDTRNITGLGAILDVNVTLNITGRNGNAFNGDLYVGLSHGSGYAVLLNSTGKTSVNDFGYADNGFNVTFDDIAVNGDVHTYRLTLSGTPTTPLAGALTGNWSPDGRYAALFTGGNLDTDARTKLLGGFNGLSANGDWTLFVADQASGGTAQLASWGLQITAVPEPAEYAVVIGGALLGLAAWRRRGRARRLWDANHVLTRGAILRRAGANE